MKALFFTSTNSIIIFALIFVWFQNFLRDLLKEAKKSEEVTDDQLIEYTDTMVSKMIKLFP